MEDQPADPGDLSPDTGEAAGAAAEADDTEVPDGTETDGTETDGTETDGTETDGTETDGTETDGSETDGTETDGTETDGAEADAPAPEPRPVGRRLTIAVVAAAVLFVAAAGFAGAAVQPYLADRATAATKLDIARTATEAITTLWSYTPENMDTLPDRASKYLGGDFASEYRSFIDAIAETNKQAQVTNTTEVLGAAVEAVGPQQATAIVYTNSTALSPASKNLPSLRYLSYRLTMDRQDGHWVITKMDAITQLDLTPQL